MAKMNGKSETAALYHQPVNEQIIPSNNNPTLDQKSEWTKLLLLIGFSGTFGASLAVGYNIGVINSPAEFVQKWSNETLYKRYGKHLDRNDIEILWSAMVSVFLIGGTIGSLGGSYIADRFGRKGAFIISSVLFLVGAVLFLLCRPLASVEIFLIARVIVGFASGLTTTSVPMYLTELAPIELRGTLGVLCPIGVTGGVVVGQVFSLRMIFGTDNLWEYAMAFYAIFVIIALIPVYFYPESPKYLYIVRKDREQAKRELYRIRANKNTIEKELEQMGAIATTEIQTRSLISVLKDPTLLLPIVIVCAFQGGQQLSGVNAVFYYSVSIFETAGLSRSEAEFANLAAGVLNLLISLLGPYLMGNFNRRSLMMMSCGISAIFLFLLSFVIHYIAFASWLSIASIFCILGYIFFYQFGLGPLPFFIGSELFDIAPRSAAMSLGSLSSWACNFIIGMAFPSMQRIWGAFVFLPFGIVCILLVLLTKFYVPETKGRDPAFIVPLVANGFRSRPNA